MCKAETCIYSRMSAAKQHSLYFAGNCYIKLSGHDCANLAMQCRQTRGPTCTYAALAPGKKAENLAASSVADITISLRSGRCSCTQVAIYCMPVLNCMSSTPKCCSAQLVGSESSCSLGM